MKKLILTSLAVVGVSSLAFAQGYVVFNVSPAGNVIGQTNSLNYSGLSAALGGGAATGQPNAGQGNTASTSVYYYELLYSTVDTTTPTSLTDLAQNWTATGLHMENSQTANNGRLSILNGTSASLVDPTYTGGNIDLMLVGWSANLGSTFTSVLPELQNWGGTFNPVANSYFGESYVGVFASISTSSTTGSTIFAPAQGENAISNPSTAPLVLSELQAVPEPCTLAFAALGGASLLLFRRKK